MLTTSALSGNVSYESVVVVSFRQRPALLHMGRMWPWQTVMILMIFWWIRVTMTTCCPGLFTLAYCKLIVNGTYCNVHMQWFFCTTFIATSLTVALRNDKASVYPTGSALTAASDIHWQVPTYMAETASSFTIQKRSVHETVTPLLTCASRTVFADLVLFISGHWRLF